MSTNLAEVTAAMAANPTTRPILVDYLAASTAAQERRAAALAEVDAADMAEIAAEVTLQLVAPARVMLDRARADLAVAEARSAATQPALDAANGRVARLEQEITDLRAVEQTRDLRREIKLLEEELSEAWSAATAPRAQHEAAGRELAAARRAVDVAQKALAEAEAVAAGPWWLAKVPSVFLHAVRVAVPGLQSAAAGEKLDGELVDLLKYALRQAHLDWGSGHQDATMSRIEARGFVDEQLRRAGLPVRFAHTRPRTHGDLR